MLALSANGSPATLEWTFTKVARQGNYLITLRARVRWIRSSLPSSSSLSMPMSIEFFLALYSRAYRQAIGLHPLWPGEPHESSIVWSHRSATPLLQRLCASRLPSNQVASTAAAIACPQESISTSVMRSDVGCVRSNTYSYS